MESTEPIIGTIITNIYRRRSLPEYGNRLTTFNNDPNAWSINKVILHPKVPVLEKPKIDEEIAIEFGLPEYTDFLIGIRTKKLYMKGRAGGDEFWLRNNLKDKVMECFVRTDFERVYIVGKFIISTPDRLAEVSIKEYSFSSFFDGKNISKEMHDRLTNLS